MSEADPFDSFREDPGVLRCPHGGESIVMLLRHAEIREAAKDWQRFSSDAPFRVPIPSEEKMRAVRQLPIETDPPEHTEWRELVQPFFKRPRNPEVVLAIRELVERLIGSAIEGGEIEVVHEFSLPLQSRALTHLLAVPEEEAEEWIGWGIKVFSDDEDGLAKGVSLDRYLRRRIDQAAANPGEDFFSALLEAEFGGRSLTRDEMLGIANLVFAGGRDTIIHTVSFIIAHLADEPDVLPWLREKPERAVLAAEEYFRVTTPLTHIGRVCPVRTEVDGETVDAGERISLGWAAGNHDPAAFAEPGKIDLARKPNPHLAFGAGPHFCLGAAHARLVIRLLLEQLASRIGKVTVTDREENREVTEKYQRAVGYTRLLARFSGQ